MKVVSSVLTSLARLFRASGNQNKETPEEMTSTNSLKESQVNDLWLAKESYWLAACLLSETDQDREAELVAEVIRNRVERGGWWGNSYEEVILAPKQFSFFNEYEGLSPGDAWEAIRNTRVGPAGNPKGFYRMLKLAQWSMIKSRECFTLNEANHFYSPVSMVPQGSTPQWAYNMMEVPVDGVDENRFVFLESGVT